MNEKTNLWHLARGDSTHYQLPLSRPPVIHGSVESTCDSLLNGIDPWGVCDCFLLRVCLCPLFEFTAATTLCVMWKASHGFHSQWENRRFQCFTTALVENTGRLHNGEYRTVSQWRIDGREFRIKCAELQGKNRLT